MDNKNRKQEIIEGAIDLFYENGLDNTSMQDIANRIGISKGTLYFYYDSKNSLIQDTYQYCYQMDIDACNKGLEQDNHSIDKLCHRFKNIIEYQLSHPKQARMEQLYSLSSTYGDMEMRCKKEFWHDIETVIKEGIAKKEIKNESSWLLTTVYYGMASQMYIAFDDDPSLWNEETINACFKLIRDAFSYK